ncbi:type II secretion system F family protein [Curvibacter sp. CHRR-16]|uniref:type II secretion system F family protein n=1 Tax=Curvibacter sp. CHRR-16 TaxID=2835872 RepID=UPI001BD99FB4|nr:type II secretion system F family protein [Curvibacter sp. CHRR-16]MBT0570732.1 type II secretion system F family protein [Curvibacter sp. CHRR-16]
MLDLFTLLVFLLVLVGFFAARAIFGRQRHDEAISQRLEQIKAELLRDSPAAIEPIDDSIGLQPDRSWLPARLQRWAERNASIAAQVDALHMGLQRIGWLPSLRSRLLLTVAVASFGGALFGRMTAAPVLTGCIAGVVCFVAIVWLGYQAAMNQYLQALARHLPECIDAITRICRAGVPLHSAFAIAADNMQGPLTDELRQVDQWLRLGLSLRQVMQASAQRVPLAEYRFFAVILIISQESGGRLGDTLERLSATLRTRAELKMKVMAKTSEARASTKIVALLVPGVLGYMYLNAPADFRFMFSDPAGIKVTIYALVSVAFGLLITHLMVRRVG